MKFKFEYHDNDERQSIIDEHSDKFLIEEQNITEGNFLIFSDVPNMVLETEIATQKEQLTQIKKGQVVTNQLIVENTTAQQDLLELLIEMGVI